MNPGPTPSSDPRSFGIRQCPFCGLPVSRAAAQCPACREVLPGEASQQRSGARSEASSASSASSGSMIRRGLLYMLLAGVIQYFSGGYSALHVPVAVSSIVTTYLAPLLFLSGFGMTLFGMFFGHRTPLVSANQ